LLIAALAFGFVRAGQSIEGWSWNGEAAAVAESDAGSNFSPDGWSWGDEPESLPAAES
jgi:hypothetical protein